MKLTMKNYREQCSLWPSSGKHIMAQFTDKYVVVYQAYRPSIGRFAVMHQYFGGEFSYTRMSWIKPNFLWMMYRSGWGVKPGQETVLAIKLKRHFFDAVLAAAVPSSYDANLFTTKDEWQHAINSSNVRLQWDPDHDPLGNKESRRAIQLGLRNEYLIPFKGDAILEIEDVSDFVKSQRTHIYNGEVDKLMMPEESVYKPSHKDKLRNINLDISLGTCTK